MQQPALSKWGCSVCASYLVVLHDLLWRNLHRDAIWTQRRVQNWVLVHVGYDNGLTDGWFIVQPRAPISMAASPA